MSIAFLKDNQKVSPHEDPLRLNIIIFKGQKRISSIELYNKMGLRLNKYSRWGRSIVSRGIDGEDYIVKILRGGPGLRTKEYLLSLTFARELCFYANLNKAFQLRKFIIEQQAVNTHFKS